MKLEAELAELTEAIARLRKILEAQLRLVNQVIHIINRSKGYVPPDHIKNGFSERAREIIPLMIQGAGTSCHTLIKVSKGSELQVRDCFPIARSIVESIVNVCFILAQGDKAAKRAQDHAFQKSYRDMERAIQSRHWTVLLKQEGQPDPSAVEGLKEALAQWTNKRGREHYRWTDESVEERINIVSGKFGHRVDLELTFATFSIYRHASEIIHGTYFGCLYFFGATQGHGRDSEQARIAIANHLMLILMAVINANSALITVVSNAYALEGAFKPALDRVMAKLYKIPLFQRHLYDENP